MAAQFARYILLLSLPDAVNVSITYQLFPIASMAMCVQTFTGYRLLITKIQGSSAEQLFSM